MERFCLLMLAMAFVAMAASAGAQMPPTPAEMAAYQGLHAAAAAGDADAITHLLAAGAGTEERDGNGRTPLHVAAFGSHGAAVAALIKGGADPRAVDNQRYDIVTIAAVKDDTKMVVLALELGADARAITSPYNGTALIAAAHLGHEGVVRELIRFGAPLDHVNNLGWTALIEAVILGDGGPRHVATARALVEAGADVRIADRAGVAPLAHARRRAYATLVEVLEKAEQGR